MGHVAYVTEDRIGIITISRPSALNALNSQVLNELDSTLDQVDTDAVRVLILTGAGEKAFVAIALYFAILKLYFRIAIVQLRKFRCILRQNCIQNGLMPDLH